jgi:hypothetical protein
METTTPTLPNEKPLTIADLERLIDKLALMPNEGNEEKSSINAKRIMYKFWLRTDNEQELALMLYLDLLRRNRKLQPFIKIALRAAILETARFGDYFDKADELYMQIAEMMNKIDWSRE